MSSDPEQFTDEHCDLCLEMQRGGASAYDMNLCHPSDGLDCYRIVTVYKGNVAEWERAHTERKVQPDYLTRRYWAVMVASHKTFGLPEQPRWRKWVTWCGCTAKPESLAGCAAPGWLCLSRKSPMRIRTWIRSRLMLSGWCVEVSRCLLCGLGLTGRRRD